MLSPHPQALRFHIPWVIAKFLTTIVEATWSQNFETKQ